MKRTLVSLFFITLLLAATNSHAQSVYTSKTVTTKIAEGIYFIQHKDGEGNRVFGNTTIIIGDRDVLVIDAPSPQKAAEDIAFIRSVTNKQVRFLVNTHWHPDHQRGNSTYLRAFPNLTIIAQKQMPALMQAYEPGNLKRLETNYHRIDSQVIHLKKGKKPGSSDSLLQQLQLQLTMYDAALNDLKDFTPVVPAVTFETQMQIELGNRQVELRFIGKGHSTADALLYLPKEKILITGDMVTYPVPYFFAGYPYEWIEVLETIEKEEYSILLPGHGPPLYDKNFLRQTIHLMSTIRNQVVKEIHQGGSLSAKLEDVERSIDLTNFRKQFAGSDKDNIEFFDESMKGLIKYLFYQAGK